MMSTGGDAGEMLQFIEQFATPTPPGCLSSGPADLCLRLIAVEKPWSDLFGDALLDVASPVRLDLLALQKLYLFLLLAY